tara:strand:- start:1889 stop:2263 length:375 start_codon:yes stop_codon:yes gene_type:complete
MKNVLLLIIVLVALVSCSKENTSDVRIRLSNKSQYDFKDVSVGTSTVNLDYGNLKSGQKSDYKVFEVAYRYANVRLEADGDTLFLLASDFIDIPLENGNYIYELRVNPPNEFGKLTLELRFIDE